jgi:hypothetical protein
MRSDKKALAASVGQVPVRIRIGVMDGRIAFRRLFGSKWVAAGYTEPCTAVAPLRSPNTEML